MKTLFLIILSHNSSCVTIKFSVKFYQAKQGQIAGRLKEDRYSKSPTLIFSCNFLPSNCSPSVKMSREAMDAIASCPIYSSKSSLPKSIAKIAAGSIIASLQEKDYYANKKQRNNKRILQYLY